jgi:hypothetical protein
MPRTLVRKLTVSVATLVTMLGAMAPLVPAAAAPGASQPAQTGGTLRRLGTVNLRQVAGAHQAAPNAASQAQPFDTFNGVEIPKPSGGGTTTPVPNPPTTPVVSTHPGVTGVDGISHLDQRLASNGNQFSLEPPDQGLCVGNGHVIEAVNNALTVFTANGFFLELPVTAMNDFFGLAPNVNRQHNPPTFGPFLTDPRCYFDAQTRRFYLTVAEIDLQPFTGAFGTSAATLIAVSQTDDPTGAWGLFSLDATDNGQNGTPTHANCPCFGDQPVIGADATGFYISTNEYSLQPFGTFFNGAQIYAISKRALATAAVNGGGIGFVHLRAGNLGLHFPPKQGVAAGIASVQPASTPPGAAYASNTEYFLSSFDVNVNKSDHRIAVWALGNTGSLDDATPHVRLTAKIVDTEPYAGGPPAGTPVPQKPGSRPLGEAVKEPLPTINADDDRMQAPTFLKGHLYSAITTAVRSTASASGTGANKTGANKTGIAWFDVKPTLSGGKVGGSIAGQGYVAATGGTSLMYPFVGLNQAGQGVIALSLTGPDWFPSFGYVAFGTNGPSGPVHVARPGARPEDGFTCYKATGSAPPCRWGDYSYAVADEAGDVWMAGEDIPGTPRTVNANWGTFVARLNKP